MNAVSMAIKATKGMAKFLLPMNLIVFGSVFSLSNLTLKKIGH
jgi:hypothetical protein